MTNANQSGSNIPALGVGTFRLKDDEAYNSVSMALEVGFRHIAQLGKRHHILSD